jgi:hypothetical protein
MMQGGAFSIVFEHPVHTHILINNLLLGWFLVDVDILCACVLASLPELGELLPWAGEVELPELLGELHGLHHHALHLVVIADLHVAGEGEVAALRVALKAVVGEDAAEVGFVGEEDAVHVPNLTLVPVGRTVNFHRGLDGAQLVGVRLDADARVIAERQQVVDQLLKKKDRYN